MRAAAAVLRWIRRWAVRVCIACLRTVGLLPPRMHLVWLLWMRDDMGASHPHLPTVLIEIAELEVRLAA